MTSLTANLIIGFYKGLASGTTANPALRNPVAIGNNLSMSLSSTETGGGKANTGFGIGNTRTLAASTTENLDFTSYANILNEAGSTASKIRLFYAIHIAESLASSITMGNAATPFRPLALTAAATMTLLPGEFFIFGSPTTAGMATAGANLWKVVNNDAVNAASYEIGFLGEV